MPVRLHDRLITFLFAAFLTAGGHAGGPFHLPGTVVQVVDGDTVVVAVQGAQHRVRLAGIDAPEHNQPWGEAATQALHRELTGRPVLVEWHRWDSQPPLLGVVRETSGEDVNLRQLDRGLAWYCDHCAGEQTPAERDSYAAAERAARAAGRGLWSDPNPLPPWEWRGR